MLERIRLWLRAWLVPEFDALIAQHARLEIRMNRLRDRVNRKSK